MSRCDTEVSWGVAVIVYDQFSYRCLRCLPPPGRANIEPTEVREVKKWTETDQEKRLAYIRDFAWQHAGEQMNIAEIYLQRHPGENEEYDSSLASLHEIETEMEKRLEIRYNKLRKLKKA